MKYKKGIFLEKIFEFVYVLIIRICIFIKYHLSILSNGKHLNSKIIQIFDVNKKIIIPF